MKRIMLTVPDQIKAKLDAKRSQGYSLNGWLNALLTRTLADARTPSRARKEKRATR